MIENYFQKPEKRKANNDNNQDCDKQPKRLACEIHYREQPNLDLSEDMHTIPNDIFSILTHIPDLTWKKITAENLDLNYAVMFTPKESRMIFNHLEKDITYETDSKVQVFGKWHNVPRKQASYGDVGLKYAFSGTTVSARPWTPFLSKLRDMLEAVTGSTFNFVLVNRYKDGNDHMGEHKDDEKELVQKSPIASLSFGEPRDFVFRHQGARGSKALKKIEPVRLQLQSGSILMMNFPTNSFWYHSLPVRKKSLGPRINLTFRHMHL